MYTKEKLTTTLQNFSLKDKNYKRSILGKNLALRKIYLAILMIFISAFSISAQISLNLSDATSDTGQTVDIDVTVDNFTNILLFQFSVNWDKDLYSFNSIQNVTSQLGQLTVPSNFGTPTNGGDEGEVSVSWSNSTTLPEILPNNSRLFTVRLNTLGPECSKSTIVISNEPTTIEFVDNQSNPIDIETRSGDLAINGTDCDTPYPVIIDIPNSFGKKGTNVCVPIYVNNFDEISSTTLTYLYDPAILSFTNHSNEALVNFKAENLNESSPGEISIFWFDETGNAPSTVTGKLFDLCFDVIGELGQSTPLEIQDSTAEFTLAPDDDPLPFVINNGKLTINETGGMSQTSDTLYIDLYETIVDDTLIIDFEVREFIDITSMQFTVAYNDILTFHSLEAGAIDGEFDDQSNNSNPSLSVGYSWFPSNGDPLTLEDNTAIFTTKFIISEQGEAQISIVGEPVMIEIVRENEDGQYEQLILSTTGGNILLDGNLINGIAYVDWNNNCTLDADETPLRDWFLKLDNGGKEYYLKTNSNGEYSRYLEEGEYTLNLIPKNAAWSTCGEIAEFTLEENGGEEIMTNFAAQAVAECPQAEISIINNALRRCVENTYYFTYCNYGTTNLDTTSINVNFPPELTLKSASIDTYFETGDGIMVEGGALEIGECKDFTLVLELDCESTALGETYCVEATISPYVDCNINENWSGANVEVEAHCEDDQVKFTIRNTGEGDMNAAKSFIVIEDDVMMPQWEDDYDIDKGDSVLTFFPANGSTYRLVAQQEDFHPNPNMPTAAIEGCGTDEEGSYSTGFFTQFGEDDNAPFEDIYCTEVIGSYDPNDKQGFPRGYGEEGYIYRNTDLEFLIRFQNTGNDTAFNVVITDEIVEELDLTTIRVGPASHPYTWDIRDERTLVFSFDNILLPDSNVNLVASNGFIKYSIKQIDGNPDGTKITNEANIFFDFNEPILTNTTVHTIGSAFLVSDIIDSQPLAEERVKIYPNPTNEGLWIEKLKIEDPLEIKIYGSDGKVLHSTQLSETLNYFPRSTFQNGVNFYKITTTDGSFLSGKIIVLK